MPSCQDIREYLPFYAENEIPAEVRPDVEAHLATCLVCRTEADSYRNLRSELRNLLHTVSIATEHLYTEAISPI